MYRSGRSSLIKPPVQRDLREPPASEEAFGLP